MTGKSWAEPGVGILDLASVADLTGLEIIQRIIDGRLPRPPISVAMDFELATAGAGRAVFAGTPNGRFHNPYGTVHGGYVATLMDSAMTCAVQTTIAAGFGVTTVEFKINFVKPIPSEAGRLRAVASVITSGRRLGTAEGRLLDEADTLYAHGTTTCMIYPLKI
ncbi:MAG: PaaI family thioesterase [Alphaproteobacteria bacterium]|nr:PaaI family thioesterase [Alphaproteobacteria bacterium]